MYGLPGQTHRTGACRCRTGARLSAPTHLSCYQLTIEPNTAFAATPAGVARRRPGCADMQEAIEECLAAGGFTHYETSAFASPWGGNAGTNLNYWTFGDYLGIRRGSARKADAA